MSGVEETVQRRGPSLSLIGGYGKMGQWILKFLSKTGMLDRLDVTITGPRELVGQRIAERFGVTYSPNNLDAARSRYIVICTPIDVTPRIIEEISPHLREDSVVMDICSVKTRVCGAARKLIDKGEYISLHPMFGPSVENLEGQVVIIVPVRGGAFLERLQTLLHDSHARTVVTSPEEHDYALSVVQCLTHFAYLAVGTTLKDLNFDIKESRSFSSPVYELMIDMIGRILSGDPSMYAEIQMENPYSAKVEELFLDNARRLKDAVDRRDAESFKRMMLEAARHYDDLQSAASKSNRAVAALYEEFLRIKGSVGKVVAIRNATTGVVHVGRLESADVESVTLVEGRRTVRLKTANASLLAEDEARRERLKRYGSRQRDVSFIFEERARPDVIARLIQSSVSELVEMSVIDTYRGAGIPDGKKSVTFRMEFFGDVDPSEAEHEVRRLILSMGALER